MSAAVPPAFTSSTNSSVAEAVVPVAISLTRMLALLVDSEQVRTAT
jgi:hypothetical protein